VLEGESSRGFEGSCDESRKQWVRLRRLLGNMRLPFASVLISERNSALRANIAVRLVSAARCGIVGYALLLRGVALMKVC